MITIEGSVDDGSIYDLRLLELLEKYKVPPQSITFYIPVNWAKALSKRGIQALKREDVDYIYNTYDFGSHGVDHLYLTRYPLEDQRREIFESKEYWEQGGRIISKFCYPRGYYSNSIKELVKEAGYSSSRTVEVGVLVPTPDAFTRGTTVHVGLDRQEYQTDWLTYAEDKLKEAIKRADKEEITYHWWGHSEEINRYNQWGRFEKFLKMLYES